MLLDDEGDLKLADFGLNNYLTDGAFLRTVCGSPHYAAPELLSKRPYFGGAVDIWSAGVVLFLLLTGRLPFASAHYPTLLAEIHTGQFSIPHTVSRSAGDLLMRILQVDPIRRISVQQIQKHPWYLESLPSEQFLREDVVKQRELLSKNMWRPERKRAIDNEILEEVLRMPCFAGDAAQVRESIYNNRSGDSTVCYNILSHDKQKENRRILNSLKLSPAPLFSLENKEFHRKDSTRSSCEIPMTLYYQPSNWTYGLRCAAPSGELCRLVLECLVQLGTQWKQTGNCEFKLRTGRLVFSMCVYQTPRCHVLDFVLCSGVSAIWLSFFSTLYGVLSARHCINTSN